MRALALDGIGGLDRLSIHDLAEPEITSPDDVLVRVKAAALNRLDLFVSGGLPGVEYQFPHILGSDAAGTVEAVGNAVTDFRPGDRVMVNPGLSCGRCVECTRDEEPLCRSYTLLGEHRSGTLAELITVPAANLALVPPEMPWAQAAAFSLATLTAWRMLTTRARLQSGETVLIWGIGGGVAQQLLQIARVVGARAIVTGGSEAKLELGRRLGAEAAIDHRTADVVAEVKRLTDRRGADVVADSVGEASWERSLRALRRGGRLVICGATTGPQVSLDLRRLFWHQWSVLGSTMGSRREYAEVVGLAGQRQLWPVVDQVVPLDAWRTAFDRLADGEQTGKLVIEVTT